MMPIAIMRARAQAPCAAGMVQNHAARSNADGAFPPTVSQPMRTRPSRPRLGPVILLLLLLPPAEASSAPSGGDAVRRSITDTSLRWPSRAEFVRVFSFRDHNTRVVVLGTMMLAATAGMIGSFLLLRKRALLGDALSHAALPGIALAFVVMTAAGGSGKLLWGLLLGASLSGSVGLACVLLIRRVTRIKEDAALAIVLSVFFGLGVAILGVIQKMDTGHAAGLESFIYGKTASMLTSDAMMIALAAAVVAVVCTLMFKEFSVLCFDEGYAASQGLSVLLLDAIMMLLAVLVTVIGLQSVGLILMIALLVVPPAAARFWTHHLPTMVLVSAMIGAVSGFIGAALSALMPRLPAGAVIVIVATAAFVVSLVFGRSGGLLMRWLEHHRLTRKVAQQHLLRAMFERVEAAPTAARGNELAGRPVSYEFLLSRRSWSPRRLGKTLSRAKRQGLVRPLDRTSFELTAAGATKARRVVRNHRLWELYLITYADIAPSHVDRDADQLEHVLDTATVHELEDLLALEAPHLAMPISPHTLSIKGGNGNGPDEP